MGSRIARMHFAALTMCHVRATMLQRRHEQSTRDFRSKRVQRVILTLAWALSSGRQCWRMESEAWCVSPSKNAQEAVKHIKSCSQEKEPGRLRLKQVPTPFARDCRPEINPLSKPGADEAPWCVSDCWSSALDGGWSKLEEWVQLQKWRWHRS